MPSLFNSFKITMLSYAYMLTDIVTKSFHDLKLQRDMDILQESCEYTNSHNCHIGMASLRHELQVSVLRKTMRFHFLSHWNGFFLSWAVKMWTNAPLASWTLFFLTAKAVKKWGKKCSIVQTWIYNKWLLEKSTF